MTLNATVGDPDADSYSTLIELADYHLSRANDAWNDGSDDEQEAAARRATVWLDAVYRLKWLGTTTNKGPSPPAQALAWPRSDVVDNDGVTISDSVVPRAVKYAQAEAALRELVNPGSLSPDIERETRRETVGPITVEYVQGSSTSPQPSVIDNILSGLLSGGGLGNVTFFARA